MGCAGSRDKSSGGLGCAGSRDKSGGGKLPFEIVRELDGPRIRLVCISDTHNCHRAMRIPTGDVLIHAGDATDHGTYPEFEDFFDWFCALPHEMKVFVPGNHDIGLDAEGYPEISTMWKTWLEDPNEPRLDKTLGLVRSAEARGVRVISGSDLGFRDVSNCMDGSLRIGDRVQVRKGGEIALAKPGSRQISHAERTVLEAGSCGTVLSFDRGTFGEILCANVLFDTSECGALAVPHDKLAEMEKRPTVDCLGYELLCCSRTPGITMRHGFDLQADRAEAVWAAVPEGVELLVTHGPPAGILDAVLGMSGGDAVLRTHVERVKPILHVFGHVHLARGTLITDRTTYINAACGRDVPGVMNCGLPMVFDLPARRSI